MSGHEDGDWIVVNTETGEQGVVREAKMTPVADYALFRDRSMRREYDGDGVLRFESERRKHGLVRVWELEESGRQTLRYYWRRLRVPWLVWAMFS